MMNSPEAAAATSNGAKAPAGPAACTGAIGSRVGIGGGGRRWDTERALRSRGVLWPRVAAPAIGSLSGVRPTRGFQRSSRPGAARRCERGAAGSRCACGAGRDAEP